MSEPQLKFVINVPTDFTETERDFVSELVIEHIQKRTDNHKDINGKQFTKYSKEYTSSRDFKLAGKSAGDVNLRQTGDTMDLIEVLSSTPGRITIGYEKGSEENDKAQWLQASDNGPSRKFLGIKNKDLKIIIDKVKSSRSSEDSEQRRARNSIVNSILKGFGV